VIFDAVDMVFIFALAVFLGFEVISKVPSILHTPLMSGSNAIHGVILVGAMVIASLAQGALQTALALLAVFLATLNIVGGVVVTDRMLDMFKGRQQSRAGPPAKGEAGSGAASSTASSSSASSEDGKQRPQP
jgi:NAD(P) transhydrogenase subunit alpha